jgi:hypothetical protein
MGSELKPCPFCGLNDAVADIDGAGLVKCRRCWVSDPDTGEVGARPWGLRFADDAATARAEAAEQRAEAAEREVARVRGAWPQAEAAAHFCQSVAHLLASPGAEAEAVQHLRADDLPHLLDCLRGRLMLSATEPRWVRLRNKADLVAEAQPAEVSDV